MGSSVISESVGKAPLLCCHRSISLAGAGNFAALLVIYSFTCLTSTGQFFWTHCRDSCLWSTCLRLRMLCWRRRTQQRSVGVALADLAPFLEYPKLRQRKLLRRHLSKEKGNQLELIKSTYLFRGILWLLADDVEHTVLQGLLILWKSVLLPSVVEDASVEIAYRHTVLKKATAKPVVGLLLELELSAVLHELLELVRVTAAELLERQLDLLLLDSCVLFILGSTWESLPGELALEEVQNHVPDTLQIVSSRLLDAFMSRNWGVPSRSSQVFPVLVRDVLALAVFVALGEAEVDDIDLVFGGLGAAD